jgi:CubicO group peptidase (beta-lactamase class C family)
VDGGDATTRSSAIAERVLDRQRRIPAGVVVGVGGREHPVIVGRGELGPDRPEAPGPATIFELGSITKVFTATLLALLAGEGVVGLDEPVNDLLPARAQLPARGRPVTLQDLSTHTSGLPRLPIGWLRRSIAHRQDPYAAFSDHDLDRAVSAAKLRREPGARVRYSNFGAGLLGHALAARTGVDYASLVEQRVCAPLGLADTRVAVAEPDLPRYADGHDARGRQVPHWTMAVLAGAGALRSTATDQLAFLAAQYRGTDDRVAATTGGPAVQRAIELTQQPRHSSGGGMRQCLGWMLVGDGPDLGRRLLVHTGGTGGFRSFCAVAPYRELRVVVLSNSARPVDKLGWAMVRAARDDSAG